ncbi:MAG: thioredoxin family protein [Candidatus Brachytrichaceae bacterium NZ_4S206]|jgi:thiol-disulfide isomerase/thioredoxin
MAQGEFGMKARHLIVWVALAAVLVACGASDRPQPIATISPHIVTVSEPSVELESQAQVSGPITFIDFYAEWCTVCKQTTPLVQQLREEFEDEVIFLSYDVDAPASRDIVRQYRVTGVPTFVILNGKQEVISRFSGGFGYADMKQQLERYTRKD